MGLLKFWKDTGSYNDPLITLTFVGSIILGIYMAGRFAEALWAQVLLFILGFIAGLMAGYALLFILCTFFARD